MLPRRTFLQGWARRGAAVSRRDAAGGHGAGARRRADRHAAGVAIEMVHGAAGCNDLGATKNLWAPGDGRVATFDLCPTALRVARTVSRLPDDRQQHRRAGGGAVRRARDRRRPLPLERGVPHPVASATDGRFRHPRRHVVRPDRTRRRFGQDTPIPSMQLCIENVDQAGGCAYGYCVRVHGLDQLGLAAPSRCR